MEVASTSTSGVNLTVRSGGTEAIGRGLHALERRGENPKPALGEIGAMLLTSTQKRFEDERDPGGRAWEPLRHRSGPILRLSGRLYQSLTYAVGSNQVEVGTNTIYARIHQMGGKAGRGLKVTIPAREYLGLDAADERESLAIVNDYLLGDLR